MERKGLEELRGSWINRNRLKPGRLDKVAMLDVAAKDMEILRLGLIEIPWAGKESDYIPWSNHCGLKLSFSI
jgi:tyrosyl-DNA phosphodiesterase 2